MELFVDPTLEFEKVAADTQLPEDPSVWPNEILQQLFKEAPYVSDFSPHIVMDKVDAERAYGFGHVEISSKTQMQPEEVTGGSRAAAGIKTARVPIIIRDGNLSPFDVMITEDGKTMPLTEQRLRQAIFRPQAFDVTSRLPGDQGIIGQLYPPIRQNAGSGGGVTMTVGTGGEKIGSVLDQVLPTIHARDYTNFFNELKDEKIKAAYLINAPATAPALSKLGQYTPRAREKRAHLLPSLLKADVAQVSKTHEGYAIKTANRSFWEPVVTYADRGEVCRRFGAKVALAADISGSVTVDGEGEPPPEGEVEPGKVPPEAQPELIKDFGIYKVKDDQGRDLIGYVFPNLLDVDGKPMPMALFTNGSQSAVQAEIAGVRVGDAVPMHDSDMRGHGAFYVMGEDGAYATMPMDIDASLNNEGSASFMATTMEGSQMEVSMQPNVDQIMTVDNQMLIPEHYHWMSLENSEPVVLQSSPDEAAAEKQASVTRGRVEIRGASHNEFHLDGMPLDKLASKHKEYLSYDDALFLLAGIGVPLWEAQQKLAEASSGYEPKVVYSTRQIFTAANQLEEAKTAGRKYVESMPDLQRILVKEAAVIPDPVAVDTVLSLGFINPENVMSFVGSMPQIENAQQRMCEMLVATRLGLRDVPGTALERAIRSTEEVLDGLHVLMFQKN